MDRRLYHAYDKITMPDGCSQRIEALLMEEAKRKPQRRNQVILRQKPRWQTWGNAAALVCLAVLISLGGVSLFVQMQKQRDPSQSLRPTEVRQETQGNPEDGETFDLSEKGKAFLLKMCYAMPDWENYYVLDNRFWEDFLFASFTCPEEVTDSRAKTIIGEVPFEDGTVLISREQAQDYATLAMGCDLPELNLNGAEGSTGIQYYDGYYHIHVSDFGSKSFQLREIISSSEERCEAVFNIYVDERNVTDGSVRFQLRKADNENGFLIVGKETEMSLPEETVQKIEYEDVLANLSGKQNQYRQRTRETDAYTAYQYHWPWEATMLSSQACVAGGTVTYSGETGEIISEDPYRMYRLEKGSWKQTELKTVTLTASRNGIPYTLTMDYGEDGNGKRYLVGYGDVISENKWLATQTGSRWGITGNQPAQPEECPDALWRFDLAAEEMEDFWGAVPEDQRVSAIYDFIYTADIFEDGSFVSAYLNEERDRCFLYADTVEGKVYDLEALVGRELDDCVGLPNDREILCWSGGEYWRISRDSLYPESLGKLQEEVLFASGVFDGKKALFSIGQDPGKTGSYRIYDYVDNRFLTLEDIGREAGEMRILVSPDGRKLLIDRGLSLIQVLDCEDGTLLTINRVNWSESGYAQWLSDEEINIHTYDQNSCVYTLK